MESVDQQKQRIKELEENLEKKILQQKILEQKIKDLQSYSQNLEQVVRQKERDQEKFQRQFNDLQDEKDRDTQQLQAKNEQLQEELAQVRAKFKNQIFPRLEDRFGSQMSETRREKLVTDFTVTNENHSIADMRELREQNEKNLDIILGLHDKIAKQ